MPSPSAQKQEQESKPISRLHNRTPPTDPNDESKPYFWEAVKLHPEYHAWVQSGARDAFAKRHNLPPDFDDDIFEALEDVEYGDTIAMEYFGKLEDIPVLKRVMRDAPTQAYPGGLLDPDVAMMMMADVEGWDDSSEDDHDDAENNDVEKNGVENNDVPEHIAKTNDTRDKVKESSSGPSSRARID